MHHGIDLYIIISFVWIFKIKKKKTKHKKEYTLDMKQTLQQVKDILQIGFKESDF